MRSAAAAVVASALAALVVACGDVTSPGPGAGGTGGPPGAAAEPRSGGAATLEDRGRADAEAHRIVSLVPAVTEMLFAIGAGPRVVGVSSFDRYPPEALALPRVGALVDPDLERIITLRPDLVVIDRGQIDLAAKLRRVGIGVFPHALGGLDHVTTTIERLGRITGAVEEARRLATSIAARLDRIRRRVEGRSRPSTLLVFGREPGSLRNIYASGGVGFLHDLIELAGGRNVFESVRRESLQASTEAILSAAPEVIIELRYGGSVAPGRLAEERASWNLLASVPAVRSGRIALLVGDELVVPGPRVADTAERLARALHPEAFDGAAGSPGSAAGGPRPTTRPGEAAVEWPRPAP